MELAGIFIVITLSIVGFLIFAAIIRYAMDTSKTSEKFDDLLFEVKMLRKEINHQNNQKHIIDKRI
jgi:type II secretory pathway component PulF